MPSNRNTKGWMQIIPITKREAEIIRRILPKITISHTTRGGKRYAEENKALLKALKDIRKEDAKNGTQ